MRTLIAITMGLSALSLVMATWGAAFFFLRAEGEPSVKLIAPQPDWEARVERSESIEDLRNLCAPLAKWINDDRAFHRDQHDLFDAAFSVGALLIIVLGCIFGCALAYVSFRLWRLSQPHHAS